MKDNTKKNIKSRRETPWTGVHDATPTQLFIEKRTETKYNNKHPRVGANGEAEFLNALVPIGCPFCGGSNFKKAGKTASGIQRFQCRQCRKTFTITTGTIFDDRKIPVTEWIEFLLDLFGYSSLTLASKGEQKFIQYNEILVKEDIPYAGRCAGWYHPFRKSKPITG